MLGLREETGEERYVHAAERIIDLAAELLPCSIAWQAHAAVK